MSKVSLMTAEISGLFPPWLRLLSTLSVERTLPWVWMLNRPHAGFSLWMPSCRDACTPWVYRRRRAAALVRKEPEMGLWQKMKDYQARARAVQRGEVRDDMPDWQKNAARLNAARLEGKTWNQASTEAQLVTLREKIDRAATPEERGKVERKAKRLAAKAAKQAAIEAREWDGKRLWANVAYEVVGHKQVTKGRTTGNAVTYQPGRWGATGIAGTTKATTDEQDVTRRVKNLAIEWHKVAQVREPWDGMVEITTITGRIYRWKAVTPGLADQLAELLLDQQRAPSRRLTNPTNEGSRR